MRPTILFLLLLSSCATSSDSYKCLEKCLEGLAPNAALLDHGRHTTLAIKNGVNFTRYGYGDWRYYGLGKTGFFNGVRALFWPTKSGIGRRSLPGPFTKENIKNRLPVEIKEITFYNLDHKKVERFEKEIAGIFAKNHAALIYNKKWDLYFVPYPEHYTLLNSSNKKIEEWMEKLGCE